MMAKQIYEAAEAAAHEIMKMYGGGTERGFGTSYGGTHLVLTQIIAKHFQPISARDELHRLALAMDAEGVFCCDEQIVIKLKSAPHPNPPSAASD